MTAGPSITHLLSLLRTPHQMKLPSTLASIALLSAVVAAQNHQVIPTTYDQLDANSQLSLPGLGFDGRMQILVDGTALQSLVGRSLTSLSFRRNVSSDPNVALSGSLRVDVGPASRTIAAPSSTFSDNGIGLTNVFDGPVSRAALPGLVPVIPSSVDDGLVEIAFTNPYPYSGGDLLIDLTGSRVPSRSGFFTIDAAVPEAQTAGTVTSFADGCGAFGPRPATVGSRHLVPGSSPRFLCVGEVGAAANLMIGLQLPQPFDLSLFGAPGCLLHVAALLEVPTVIPNSFGAPSLGGVAQVTTDLPATPHLLGASVVGQWAVVGSTIELSNALRIDLASQMPGEPISIVQGATTSTVGRVRVGVAPVLRFGYQ